MILTIAREQLRRQRGYIAALALIVTAAVGFATFATTMAATQGAFNHFADVANGTASRYFANAALTDPGLPQLANIDQLGTPLTLAAVQQDVADANTAGAEARADARGYGSITGAEVVEWTQPIPGWSGTISAPWGDVRWDRILAVGSAPGAGEIVISGEASEQTGVALGDSVKVWADYSPRDQTALSPVTLRVSGIAHDYGSATTSQRSPAFVSAGDIDIIQALVAAQSLEDAPNPVQVQVGWEQPSQVLDSTFYSQSERLGGVRLFGSSSPIAWLVAVALTLGTVVVAFALGRAQAQERMRWTATARALGARRTHLLAAAVFEWAVVAAGSAVVGIGAGVSAAAIAHRVRLNAFASPPPVALTFPGIVAAAMVTLAALLAAVTVIVPTIAALRVPPTAALKDTAAVDEMEMSRRVSAWPVGMLFVAFYLALLVAMVAQTNASFWASVFLFPATAVTGIATMVEVTRKVVRIAANTLARSAKPWALQAGLTLNAHPRQAVAIANIQMLAVTGIVGWYMADSVNQSFLWFAWISRPDINVINLIRNSFPYFGYVLAAFLTANALAAVVMWSAKRLTATEGNTAWALGFSGVHSVVANAAAWMAGQFAGILLGWAVGVFGIGGIAVALVLGTPSDPTLATVLDNMGLGIQASVFVVALAAVLAAVVAALVAVALQPRRSRILVS